MLQMAETPRQLSATGSLIGHWTRVPDAYWIFPRSVAVKKKASGVTASQFNRE